MKSTIVKILTAALAVSMMACVAVGCNGNKNESSKASTTSSQASKTESSTESKAESSTESKAESSTESKAESSTESKAESSTESKAESSEESKDDTTEASVTPGTVDLNNLTADQIGDMMSGKDENTGYELTFITFNDENQSSLLVVNHFTEEGQGVMDVLCFGASERGQVVDNGDGTGSVPVTITTADGKQLVITLTNDAELTQYTAAVSGIEAVFTMKAETDKETAVNSIKAMITMQGHVTTPEDAPEAVNPAEGSSDESTEEEPAEGNDDEE